MSEVTERCRDLYNEFHKLAQTEGNKPILCSRMHFSEWAYDVDTFGAEIERLRQLVAELEAELVEVKYNPIIKPYPPQDGREYDCQCGTIKTTSRTTTTYCERESKEVSGE